jgi:hypothetical protein
MFGKVQYVLGKIIVLFLIPMFLMLTFFVSTSCASSAMSTGDVAKELWYLFWAGLSLLTFYKWVNE